MYSYTPWPCSQFLICTHCVQASDNVAFQMGLIELATIHFF